MVRGSTSRTIFVDSAVNQFHDRTKVIVPTHPFQAKGEEKLAIALAQFSMKRNWTNINRTNNRGYVHYRETYYPFTIAPGVYTSFDGVFTNAAGNEVPDPQSLLIAVQAAMNQIVININASYTAQQPAQPAPIATIVVGYVKLTRKFTFEITFNINGTFTETLPIHIRFFALKSGAPPAAVDEIGAFNDIHEILGGIPNRKLPAVNSMEIVGAVDANPRNLISPYVASLSTCDAVYLQLSTLETGNYSSTGFDRNARDDARLIETSLFARIPISTSFANDEHESLEYLDVGNDQFQAFPLRKNLAELEIKLVDGKGRLLTELDADRASHGLMAFQAVLRIDIFKPPVRPETKKPTLQSMVHPPPKF